MRTRVGCTWCHSHCRTESALDMEEGTVSCLFSPMEGERVFTVPGGSGHFTSKGDYS